jgi:hypothetical protein
LISPWLCRRHRVKSRRKLRQPECPPCATGRTIVEGDINGDGKADFQIELSGLITLTKVDFIL